MLNNKSVKKVLKFSKKIVIWAIVLLVVYTIVSVVYQFITGFELAPTLTQMFFTVFGIELGATSLIKITDVVVDLYKEKINKDKKEDDLYDN